MPSGSAASSRAGLQALENKCVRWRFWGFGLLEQAPDQTTNDRMRKIQRHRSSPPGAGLSLQPTIRSRQPSMAIPLPWLCQVVGSAPISRDEDAELRRTQAYDWKSRGTDPEENDKRPLGSFGRVASRMNCRYRAPVPFTPLVATVLLASQSIGSRCDARKPRTRPFRRIRPAGTNG